MKRPTFENTVNVLVQAYFNDTLKHDDCTSCAVGNIITAGGYKFSDDEWNVDATHWLIFIDSNIRKNHWSARPCNNKLAHAQISASGYSPEELSLIESAFEDSDRPDTIDG